MSNKIDYNTIAYDEGWPRVETNNLVRGRFYLVEIECDTACVEFYSRFLDKVGDDLIWANGVTVTDRANYHYYREDIKVEAG